ncbi:MAG: Slp family lipoprotein [Thermodesulfobacteriota bacterium]
MKQFLFFLMLFIAGCSVISKDIRREIDRTITIPIVQANPDAYIGKKVIWGGVIISSKNFKENTTIEVLQAPLNLRDRIKSSNQSSGRFLIKAEGYLDVAIYKQDKEITVAGIILGTRLQKIGEADYIYPLLKPLQIRIFNPLEETHYEPLPPWSYYPPYFYDPFYYEPFFPYDPYLYPDDPYWWYPPPFP